MWPSNMSIQACVAHVDKSYTSDLLRVSLAVGRCSRLSWSYFRPLELVSLSPPLYWLFGDFQVHYVNGEERDSRFTPLPSGSLLFLGSHFQNHKMLEPDGTCDPPLPMPSFCR